MNIYINTEYWPEHSFNILILKINEAPMKTCLNPIGPDTKCEVLT